jgi:SAM-dependent methyltransferase
MADRALPDILRRLRRSLAGATFERKLGGVQTSDSVMLEDLGLEGAGRVEYTPSPWRELQKVLPAAQVGPEDVFADLGCGMGRAVLLAAQYPMKRVIGVELSEDLAGVARQNVEAAREHLAAGDVEIVQSDILAYDLPDDVTIVYLYNPFTGHIFAGALERIFASLDRRPRRIRMVYRHPVEHEQLMATGRVRQVGRYEPRSLLRRQAGSPTNLYELGAAA